MGPGGGRGRDGCGKRAIGRDPHHVTVVSDEVIDSRPPRSADDTARAVGLDDRDAVTLAGLIAYVNYQIRVVAGLRMLRGGP